MTKLADPDSNKKWPGSQWSSSWTWPLPRPATTSNHKGETARYTIAQNLEIINKALEDLTTTATALNTKQTMYDRQAQGFSHLLMPPPSPSFYSAAQPAAIMSVARSASPATSRGSENNDASLSPHNPQSPEVNADGSSNKGRALSTSKRAEQNRRAQRAFRERRDAYVYFAYQCSRK